MIGRAAKVASILCSTFVISAFLPQTNNGGLPAGPATHTSAPDELTVLAAGMDAGTWQKLHDDVGQPGGLRDVLLPQNTATFAINHDGNDWTADWSPWPWTGTTGRAHISSWNGGALVDKPGEHVRFYIPGAGGHSNYGGNEVYSFDVLAAAAAVNRGSRQGTEQWWQLAAGSARMGKAVGGLGGWNAKGPYTDVLQSDGIGNDPNWAPFDKDDPFGDDQCNIGPLSTHTYGGVHYHPFYDAIVVNGAGGWPLGGYGPRGIWTFDIPDQVWKLLPPDRDNTPPYDCSNATAGDLFFDAFKNTNASNIAIFMYADERMWIGNRHNSYRWRTDDVAWTVRPGVGRNNHAQKTGSKVGHPTKPLNQQMNLEHRPIAGPYGSNLGAWIFYEDDDSVTAPGVPGWAAVWPDIDVDDTTANMVWADYANNTPYANGNFLPDFTSGVYSATHDKFFFIHRPWLADFNGQVYAFDRTTLTWSTYIDPSSDPGRPTTSIGLTNNGTWGRFAYMEDRNLFLLVFDAGASPTGYTGQVYLLKGI